MAKDKKPFIPIAVDPDRLSKGASVALKKISRGRLCKQFIQDDRYTGPAYWFEPSGKSVDRASAEELIRKGRVRPLSDSLFGEDSQSFEAA